MAISDISTLSVLRTKMQWHQERQRVLAQNVANSDTPRFKPLDLVEPKFDGAGRPSGVSGASLLMVQTSPGHLASSSTSSSSPSARAGYQTRPAGNAVSLEEEMMKSSQNQMDYAAATSLYTKNLNLLKTAIGKR
ncbi:flagellar basal body rod protein FlgB [Bradyrhizobium sp. CCH5-F6]|jgi:flagellar basal-body rod protein FlgB|uniref:flagellar basal body rod protein FlgB n=1 Tax=Bradyrhizobium sp. CCH5-F6 TaxID=1768753 RepID=UPI00076A044E|nr:flagellar basal body rod protein FlgB [Bradyrhizobium sp. CCH5-F6]